MALTEWTDWRTVLNWYDMQKKGAPFESTASFTVNYENGSNEGKTYTIRAETREEKKTMSLSKFGIQYRMKMARNQRTGIMGTLYQFRLIIGDNYEGYKPPVRVDGLAAISALRYNVTSKKFESDNDTYYSYVNNTAFDLPWKTKDGNRTYGYWDSSVPESGTETSEYYTGAAPAFPVYDDSSTEFDPIYSIFGSSYEDNQFGTVSSFQITFVSEGTLQPNGYTASYSTTISPPIELTVPCYPPVSALMLPNTTTGYKFGDTYHAELQTWWPDGSKVDVDMQIRGVSIKTESFEDAEKKKHTLDISIDPNVVGQYVTDSMDTRIDVITTTRIKINGAYEVLGEHRASPTWSFYNYDLNDRISYTSPIRYNSVPILNDWPFGVTGKSGYGWNITASEMYSSPITATVEVRRNSNETYKTSSLLSDTTGWLTESGSYSIFVRVTDGRGRTGSKEFSLGTIVDDGLPSINETSISRRDASSQESEYGHYGLLKVIASPFVINYGGNKYNSIASITATYETKETEPKTYTTDQIQSNVSYLIPNIEDIESGSITDYEFSPGHSYAITVTVTDILGNEKSTIVDLAVSRTTFHLKNGGNGLGFGQYCDVPETIQSAWPMFVLGRELSHCDVTVDRKDAYTEDESNGARIRIKNPGTYMFIGLSDQKILNDTPDHLRVGVDFRVRPVPEDSGATPIFALDSFYAPFDSTIISASGVVIPKTIGIALFRLSEGSPEAMVHFGVWDKQNQNTMWNNYKNEKAILYAFRLGQYITNPHSNGL